MYVDFEDQRKAHDFQFKAVDKNFLSGITWPSNHPCAGQPIVLRDYQVETINKFIENPQCIQEIATGAGKTIITAALCQLVEPYGRTLTIVPNKSLVTQTEEDFLACNLDTGVYYGDRKEIGRYNTIATWQSLNVLEKRSKDEHSAEFKEAMQGINTVIIDEVHMAKADVLKRMLT
ncbi:MAG: DEAD/DEAH box helicase family protein, partial [Pseudomonadota bacterium]|nr:DEAD/DEAH box helicase family protein [Pseudomonadota bacterium]